MVALEMEKADSTFAEHEGLTKNGYWSNLAAYSGDTRSPIPVISVHSFGNLQYRRQS